MGKAFSSRRGDEEITYKQGDVRGCMAVRMTVGIGTAVNDINSGIGNIVTLTPNHASLPFDYAKFGCITTLSPECICTLALGQRV
jgi:hypothetical protein